jgi:hypothetical protein
MDALRAVLELALKDKALSFEARRQLVAAQVNISGEKIQPVS